MSGCKTDEAKEFYMRLCIANGYAKRDLERQIDSMLYERTMLSTAKNKGLIADYTLQLPDKKLLEEKLREITMLADVK